MKNIIIILCISALFGACKKGGLAAEEPLNLSASAEYLDSAILNQLTAQAYLNGSSWVIPATVEYWDMDSLGHLVKIYQGKGNSVIAYFMRKKSVSTIPAGEPIYEYIIPIWRIIKVDTTNGTQMSYWKSWMAKLGMQTYLEATYNADEDSLYIK